MLLPQHYTEVPHWNEAYTILSLLYSLVSDLRFRSQLFHALFNLSTAHTFVQL